MPARASALAPYYGQPVAPPVDVLTGFVDADDNAQGRPVGIAIDGRGSLLVADDVGNKVWRVSAAMDATQSEAHADPHH
jgi:glucose/arabinose dehydrogenase